MTFIAEVGCNHQGSMRLAEEHIRQAVNAGADVVKFQKRDVAWWSERMKAWSKPHPNPQQSFGPTYREHRETLELDVQDHARLCRLCHELGAGYACSVWDLQSLDDIASIATSYIKIPSALNGYDELIQAALETDHDVHLSTGMMTAPQVRELLLKYRKFAERFVIYHAVSGYPVPAEESGFARWSAWVDTANDCGYRLGFSAHHIGINLDILAVPYEIGYLERHFTINNRMKGTDHACSLEPDEFKQLIENVSQAVWARHGRINRIEPCEEPNVEKLRWIR